MNKKDIALTVGGVIATMILAWLLYRLQKKDSAAAAQAAAQEQTDAEQNTEDIYSLLSQPSYGGAVQTTTTPTIDTNADLGNNGDPDNDSAAGESVLTTLLGDLQGSLSGVNESSLIIPTINATQNNSLNTADIPTTAAQELGEGQTAASAGVTTNVVSGGIQQLPGNVSVSSRNGLPTNVAAVEMVN